MIKPGAEQMTKNQSEKQLAKIKAIFSGPQNRRGKEGQKMDYDIYFNLMGPLSDYEDNGIFDKHSYRTIKSILEKLGKIRKILLENDEK